MTPSPKPDVQKKNPALAMVARRLQLSHEYHAVSISCKTRGAFIAGGRRLQLVVKFKFGLENNNNDSTL